MKEKIKISKSFRKYIRAEKARIRRGEENFDEQRKLIEKLYQKIGIAVKQKDEDK